MATTMDDIKRWLKEAQQKNCSHLLVVCDTFDWDDYPVFIFRNEDVHECMKQFDGVNMQRITEVYNLDLDIDKQLKEKRTYHP